MTRVRIPPARVACDHTIAHRLSWVRQRASYLARLVGDQPSMIGKPCERELDALRWALGKLEELFPGESLEGIRIVEERHRNQLRREARRRAQETSLPLANGEQKDTECP